MFVLGKTMTHFLFWLIIPCVVVVSTLVYSHDELQTLVMIALGAILFITYISQGWKRYLPVAFIGLFFSSVLLTFVLGLI